MIDYICFEVSALCNMDCKFCFANWRDDTNQLSYDKIISIIDKLCTYGIKAINLTGGECLIRKDIIDIAKYCKSKGLMTIISTNGILLKEKLDILKYIDAINLPLDSYTSDIHNNVRPCALSNHHDYVLELIEYINEFYPNIKIKINTCVSKQNINNVVNIGELLEGKVYSWKLGKFFSSGYGANYEEDFAITEEEFNNVLINVNEKYKNSNIVSQALDQGTGNIINVFIDCHGKVNIHGDKGIETYDDFEELDRRIEEENVKHLKKEFLDKAYM